MRRRLRLVSCRVLVATGSLWLTVVLCVVAAHQPQPGRLGSGLSLDQIGATHRAWHQHSVGPGGDAVAGWRLDECVLCVARSNLSDRTIRTGPSHPAGDHWEAVPSEADRPLVEPTRRPRTRAPPLG